MSKTSPQKWLQNVRLGAGILVELSGGYLGPTNWVVNSKRYSAGELSPKKAAGNTSLQFLQNVSPLCGNTDKSYWDW